MNTSPALTPDSAARLARFLAHPARPAGTLRYGEAAGFLYAVATFPDAVAPSEWLPLIFDSEDAGYKDIGEAQEILGLLMGLYNAVNAAVLAAARGEAVLPPGCELRTPALANQADDAPLHLWSMGFMAGYDWLSDGWQEVVDDDDDEFGTMLITLGFFSSQAFADAIAEDVGEEGDTVASLADSVVQDFPAALGYLAQFGRGPDGPLAE